MTATRQVIVEAERVEGWLARFADRHGPTTWTVASSAVASAEPVTVTAADGATARCAVPFPPLLVDDALPFGGLIAHALTDRRVGVLAVRRGGHAAGVFEGTTLVSSKVGSRHVQGRTAAGGQSQQRFARRREGQAKVAQQAAADVAVRILVPAAATLDAVVLGGDRRSVDAVLADRRLAGLLPLVSDRWLDVPDPRLTVLKATPARFRAVAIDVTDPA